MRSKSNLAVMQVTPFCNLDCSYCYLPDRVSRHRMPAELAGRIATEMYSLPGQANVHFNWHAGEPLSVPPDYFLSLLNQSQAASHSYGLGAHHSVQTNGTTLNTEWCDILLDHRVAVGVSVDGPHFLHDSRRVTRQNKPSLDRTLRGIEFLRHRGIPFSILCVLTSESLNYPTEIFRFLVSLTPKNISFNFEEEEGVNRKSSLSHHDRDRVKKFFETILSLSEDIDQKINIREIDQIIVLALYGEKYFNIRSSIGETQYNVPILTFDCYGNIYPFAPEFAGTRSDLYGDYSIGNIKEVSLREALRSDAMRKMWEDNLRGQEKCREDCEFFGLCGGDMPSNKAFENGSLASSRTVHCTLRKMAVAEAIYDHVGAR